jgi:hypothetical protein
MGEPEVFNHHVLDCGTRRHCDLRQRRLNRNLGHLRPSEAVLLLILSKDLNGAQRLNDLNVWNKPKVIQSDAAGTWQSEGSNIYSKITSRTATAPAGNFLTTLWNARLAVFTLKTVEPVKLEVFSDYV